MTEPQVARNLSEDEFSDEGSFDEELEWELEEGIPQFEDQFLQKYVQGRDALIEEESKQRHDYTFRQNLSPMAAEASRIVSLIRKQESKEIWTKDARNQIADANDAPLYPGMQFTLAREKIETTKLWKIVSKMPKGALLHAHMNAMVDTDWLIEQTFSVPGFHIFAPEPLDSERKLRRAPFLFGFVSSAKSPKEPGSIWSSDYKAQTPIPVAAAAMSFPNGGEAGFRAWLSERMTISVSQALQQHHGVDDIWAFFETTFPIISSITYYEPVFRASMNRMLSELNADGIRYVEFRLAFVIKFSREGHDDADDDFTYFYEIFGEEIEKFKARPEGAGFHGARMIWTGLRILPNRAIIQDMKNCMEMKEKFPHLISGYDLVGQEEQGRPLIDLTPTLFWFRKQCAIRKLNIPFFFHAGECVTWGDSVDSNLFDAVLLGTRRLGHAFSLYKHPLLINMVKEKSILVESCPISNEVLRLTASILTHPLPALLAANVPVALANDDPAILGHGKNGLSHDFWQTLNAYDNMGLTGLASVAENSLRWSQLEDQDQKEWIRGVKEGAADRGSGQGHVKGELLRQWRKDFDDWCAWVVKEFALDVPVAGEDGEDEE